MSAETLRRAAALMREQHGPEHKRHEMWNAMAEWLDSHADFHCVSCEPGICYALIVARAYLGEVSA